VELDLCDPGLSERSRRVFRSLGVALLSGKIWKV
jgi:hypothetical protein